MSDGEERLIHRSFHLPEHVVALMDRYVPKRERSRFVAMAVERALTEKRLADVEEEVRRLKG